MQDRIKAFLQHKGMTPAELADSIGIQRSNLSHVLNGRNKPSSIFIEKFLSTFPKLNARWLLLGVGEMYMGNPLPQSLFEETQKETVDTTHKEKKTPIPQSAKTILPDIPANNGLTIEKIVVFYNNKTFREYNPE